MAACQIRVIALALVREADRILVSEAFDSVKRETFYRLLGGGVEFGETGRRAVTRELDEELGAQLEDVSYVATLENIFVYEGQPGHEIALIYEAAFRDRALRARRVGNRRRGRTGARALEEPRRLPRRRKALPGRAARPRLVATQQPRRAPHPPCAC